MSSKKLKMQLLLFDFALVGITLMFNAQATSATFKWQWALKGMMQSITTFV
jgi:hypothetical protein